jgi:site-specific DNA-methyltransferase (adenine-specific)
MTIKIAKLIHGDCLKKMLELPENSVDMILADPPYGTTACKWDAVIDLKKMWDCINFVTKKNIAIVLFCQQPFTSRLISSNYNMYKYMWYWRKNRPSGFVNAKLKPLKDIEEIVVFSNGTTANGSDKNMPYFPQGLKEVNKSWSRPKRYGDGKGVNCSRKTHKLKRTIKYENYPRQVLDYNKHNKKLLHPTQKPIPLLQYLIKTYTNENDTVLDFCFGSCSTGVACKKTNRNFIGIEKDEQYFNIGTERLQNDN